MTPDFLTFTDLLYLHQEMIARYGGTAGIRDEGLLRSALAGPAAGIGDTFFHADLFAMAAAYLYVIVCNHPFVDGNKRVGAAAALLFLALNGIEIYADEDAFGDLVFAVAENRASKDAIAMFLRAHTVY